MTMTMATMAMDFICLCYYSIAVLSADGCEGSLRQRDGRSGDEESEEELWPVSSAIC